MQRKRVHVAGSLLFPSVLPKFAQADRYSPTWRDSTPQLPSGSTKSMGARRNPRELIPLPPGPPSDPHPLPLPNRHHTTENRAESAVVQPRIALSPTRNSHDSPHFAQNPAPARLRPAKRSVDKFFRPRRHRVPRHPRPLLKWPRNSLQQRLKRLKILPFTCSAKCLFYKVVTRNDQRIHPSHRRRPSLPIPALSFQPPPPFHSPFVICRGVREKGANAIIPFIINSRIAQPPEGQRKIRLLLSHPSKQIFRQRRIPLALRK